MLIFFFASPLFLFFLLAVLGLKAWDSAVFLWLFINALLSPTAGAEGAILGTTVFVTYTFFMIYRVSKNT